MADTPVDLTHLARYTGGDKALNAEILSLFDGQVSEMVGQLLGGVGTARRAQVARGHPHHQGRGARCRRLCHGRCGRHAEPVDPANNPDRAIEVIEALRVEGEAVQAFIAEYLAA